MPTPRSSDECEDRGDDELTGDENEPSLGSLDRQTQTRSYQHSPASWGSPDLEGDGDGREADLEPSLAAPEPAWGNLADPIGHVVVSGRFVRMNIYDQTHWAKGGSADCELGDDNGLGDASGLHEQIDGREEEPWAR